MRSLTKIGILDVQGAVREHADRMRAVGADVVLVKHAQDLDAVQGLILPGGESTTIGKLIRKYDLYEPIRSRIEQGMPVFGTCAGMILLAKSIHQQDDVHLGVMDITVDRNSFGRQRESFEADLNVAGLSGDAYPAVFIRAPQVLAKGEHVDVIATYDGHIVGVREHSMLATSFHPELTEDTRLHAYFLAMVNEA